MTGLGNAPSLGGGGGVDSAWNDDFDKLLSGGVEGGGSTKKSALNTHTPGVSECVSRWCRPCCPPTLPPSSTVPGKHSRKGSKSKKGSKKDKERKRSKDKERKRVRRACTDG